MSRQIIPTGCYVVCTCRVLARLFKNKRIRIRIRASEAGVEKIFKGEKIGEADFTPRTYFCKASMQLYDLESRCAEGHDKLFTQ